MDTPSPTGRLLLTTKRCFEKAYILSFSPCLLQFVDLLYSLDGNQAEYLGEGDLHEPSPETNEQCRYIDFNENYYDPAITTMPGHCVFSYRVYPSQLFYSAYTSNLPVQLALVIATIFVIMGITFFVLLHFVEKRHDMIVGEAAISNAIVSSLFPASVRKRLFADRAALLPAETYQAEGKSGLRKFLTGELESASSDGNLLKRKPIADHFPSCTVFFSDIVGKFFPSEENANDVHSF